MPKVSKISAPYSLWPGSDEHRIAIVLDLPKTLFDALPQTVEWMGQTYIKKDEFHVTLVHTTSQIEPTLTNLFTKHIAESPIKLISFQNELRSAQKGENCSIAIRCKVTNLESLFEKIKNEMGIEIPPQPTHVTLYSIEKNVGIAIDSEEEMTALPLVSLREIDPLIQKRKGDPEGSPEV